jgi:hypothetical protein
MVMCIAPNYSISSVMGKLKSQSASQFEEGISMGGQGVLEREYCMVLGLLRQQRRRG